jgi:cytochrome c-type biogenesis protein CcsB
MANINFEILLGNLSFVVLFLIMILYWVQAIFSIIPKFNFIIFFITLFTNIALFLLLILRWSNYGHFPLSNLYESLIFLSWSFTLIELILISSVFHFNFNMLNLNILKNFLNNESINLNHLIFKNSNFSSNTSKTLKEEFVNPDINIIIGTVLSPIALFTNSFAAFSLPKNMQKAQALVPALQSNWLMMHVTVMMLSYAALLCGSLLAITFLVITWDKPKSARQTEFKSFLLSKTDSGITSQEVLLPNNIPINTTNQAQSNLVISPKSSTELLRNQNGKNNVLMQNQKLPINMLAKTLDNLSYRILGIGFPLLTIGILSGAVWANEAWGSYWSWDPKETWAFITWLIFAIYLHTRITKGWEGKKPAILASFGFLIVWICYLGVNILGSGLHSYGWIQLGT